MLMRSIELVIFSVLIVLFCSFGTCAQTSNWKMVHGEVVQVFPEQHKLLLGSEEQKQIFRLDDGCVILRSGSPVALASLRPIAPAVYQDVLCWVNERGRVDIILVNYCVQEENGVLVSYDIFGNLK